MAFRHVLHGLPEQCGQFAGVGGEHEARPALEQAGLPGEGVEPVCVEHQRERTFQHYASDSRGGGRIPAQPRPGYQCP